jgi:hypothetical protein
MADIHEPDWKTLRALKPVLLDRLCTRILDECRRVIDDPGRSAHERYLALFKLLRDRDEDVASAFNDLSRSRAVWKLAWMRHLGLFTQEEWMRLSPGTRETVQFLSGELR